MNVTKEDPIVMTMLFQWRRAYFCDCRDTCRTLGESFLSLPLIMYILELAVTVLQGRSQIKSFLFEMNIQFNKGTSEYY